MANSTNLKPGEPAQPKAIVHKQILAVAAKQPDAPMDEIAKEVTGANTSLVEKGLTEYGDPATDSAKESPNEATGPTGAESRGDLTATETTDGSSAGEHADRAEPPFQGQPP